MNCPNCGAANGTEAKFCVTCGTPLSAEEPVVQTPAPEATPEVTPAAEEKAAAKLDVKEILAQLKNTVLSVFNPLLPYLKNKKVLIGAGAVLAALIVITVLCGVLGGGNGFINYKTIIMPVNNGDGYSFIVNNKALSDTVEIEDIDSSRTSIDGSIMAFVSENEDGNELFVIKGKKIISVAEDVADFELSVTGKGIAYVVENEDPEDEAYYTLYLYNVGNGKTTTVSEEVRNMRFAIAPDGGSVAYYVPGEENPELMYSKGSKQSKVTSAEVDLLGMSNNGKYIYATEDKETEEDGIETILYAYNTKGEKEKLGKINSSSVRFNYAHTQILFYNEGKSYISTNGKEAVKASSDRISLINAPTASSFNDGLSTTYPVKDLYNHVYSVSGENTSAWIIKKNAEKNIKLVSKISGYTLDNNAEYLYYIYDHEELRVIKLSDGERAGERAVTLAEEIDNYVVTSDAKKVYYVADDGLYVVNGTKGGKPKTIVSDDVNTGLAINSKNVVYYTMDGDLYATTGGKGTKVLSDADGVTDTPTGIVFASGDEKLYISTGSKKLKKLMDLG